MPFDIVTEGFVELLSALRDYADIAAPIMEESSGAALMSLIGPIASYPPAPQDSTYRRTGTLGRLWTNARPEFALIATGFEATIGNATPYGPYVQSADDQAAQHQGRWQTDQDVIDQHRVEIDQFFEEALRAITDAIDAKAGP